MNACPVVYLRDSPNSGLPLRRSSLFQGFSNLGSFYLRDSSSEGFAPSVLMVFSPVSSQSLL